jgi:Flp pilus assembly pilin Flp
MNLFTYLRALGRNDEGQDMIEYALIASLIAVVAVIAVGATGTQVGAMWTTIQNAVTP